MPHGVGHTSIPKSGTGGNVQAGGSDLVEIKNWTFTRSSNNPSWASNVSAGYTKRVAGVKDGTVSMEFVYDFADSIEDRIKEGDSVTLLLFSDATRQYSVPAIVDSLEFNSDMDDGEPFGGTITASTNGAWTDPT